MLKNIINSIFKPTKNINLKVESSGVTSHYTKPKRIIPKNLYTDDELFDIRQNIIKARRNKNINQKELSESLGQNSTSFISRLERGDLMKITHEQVENLSKCLEVDISDLLIGREKV